MEVSESLPSSEDSRGCECCNSAPPVEDNCALILSTKAQRKGLLSIGVLLLLQKKRDDRVMLLLL